jgi:tRNA threonylcarbamoyladenosine biosynthesis protein TsaB
MIILTLRTDKPEAEICLYDGDKRLAYEKWEAHRQLAETLHTKIKEILNQSSISWDGIGAIVCYKGPGSFTGLRIGLSVANALAYAQDIPIVTAAGENWIKDGLSAISSGKNKKIALPEYGSPPHITQQKK